MELTKVGERTYYIANATNIGVYKIDDTHVWLIDSGNDKEAGKKILKLLDAEGLTVAGILNTHSNADHIGGNRLIADRTGAPVYARGIERDMTAHPILEPSFLYGGYPFADLRNKFLLAKASSTVEIGENLPDGLEIFDLPGHFFDMIGVRTSDDVVFLADCLFSEETIRKYHLFFLYDVRGYLETLDALESLSAKLFVPSHCAPTNDLTDLIAANRAKVHEIAEVILDLCETERTAEEILAAVFERYALTMNVNQYVLVGSTVRSYLAYLCDEGRVAYSFQGNKMVWKKSE